MHFDRNKSICNKAIVAMMSLAMNGKHFRWWFLFAGVGSSISTSSTWPASYFDHRYGASDGAEQSAMKDDDAEGRYCTGVAICDDASAAINYCF